MKGKELALKALLDKGVKYIFGYTGGAIMPIFDEMEKQCKRLLKIKGLTAWEKSFLHNMKEKCKDKSYEFNDHQFKKVNKIEQVLNKRLEQGITQNIN